MNNIEETKLGASAGGAGDNIMNDGNNIGDGPSSNNPGGQ